MCILNFSLMMILWCIIQYASLQNLLFPTQILNMWTIWWCTNKQGQNYLDAWGGPGNPIKKNFSCKGLNSQPLKQMKFTCKHADN